MAKAPAYILTDPSSGRHLYKRGWLGLIPLVGAFVGIGLVTLGIVRYRDKKLVAIGLAAVLFTIVVYGSLFYFIGYSDLARKGEAKTQPGILNEVVKAIEFYKLQNGHYPDSIQQVHTKDEPLIIFDVLSKKGFGDYNTFFYQRIDSGYTLYSCGLDQKLHTSDDIFPSVESTNIGLIKDNR